MYIKNVCINQKCTIKVYTNKTVYQQNIYV